MDIINDLITSTRIITQARGLILNHELVAHAALVPGSAGAAAAAIPVGGVRGDHEIGRRATGLHGVH